MFRRTPDRKIERIRQIGLFRAFSDKELEDVARHVDEVDADTGEVLTRQGAKGQEVLVIVEGGARVERDGQELAALGPNDVVGEMSIIDQQPQSATVTVTEPSRLLVMHRTDLVRLMDEVPGFTRKVLESVVQRLREADERLVG